MFSEFDGASGLCFRGRRLLRAARIVTCGFEAQRGQALTDAAEPGMLFAARPGENAISGKALPLFDMFRIANKAALGFP